MQSEDKAKSGSQGNWQWGGDDLGEMYVRVVLKLELASYKTGSGVVQVLFLKNGLWLTSSKKLDSANH